MTQTLVRILPLVVLLAALAALAPLTGTPLLAQEASPPQNEPTAEENASPRARAFDHDLLERLERLEERAAENPKEEISPELRAAVRAFQASGTAPVVQHSTAVAYPYGKSQPMIYCTPDRVCDVELQAGEVIYDVALGDQRRWTAQPLTSGDPERPTPHVMVKPTEHGHATNLVVGTSKRTYHIGLYSPTLEQLNNPGGRVHYNRHIAFYYPDEIIASWQTAEDLRELRRLEERRKEQKHAGETRLHAPIADLNFAYTLRPSKKKIAWTPTAVYDDGVRTYIQLPRTVRSTNQPALVLEENGESVVPNFHYDTEGRKIVVHTLFDEATLFEGVGKKRVEVRILSGVGR